MILFNLMMFLQRMPSHSFNALHNDCLARSEPKSWSEFSLTQTWEGSESGKREMKPTDQQDKFSDLNQTETGERLSNRKKT